MAYRRFGRTERELSVITLGGMRYHRGWEQPRDELPAKTISQATDITRRSLDAGINHIETAWGYGKSEHIYGQVLNQELAVPRNRYHLMTKSGMRSADEIKRTVEAQLSALQTDHIDLYAWHGMNTQALFEQACAPGGPVEALHQLREQGVLGTVGFSTHAPLPVICQAIATDLFDFVNLHYYYFFQRNLAAVQLAAAHDMGVFIISPNDKGGQLFHPSAKLTQLCQPLTPIQFNARWCLRTADVHTLSFGLSEPEHIDEMLGVMPVSLPLGPQEQRIEQNLNRQVAECDPSCAYEGYELANDPSQINIPEILRFRRMWKCYDMLGFGHYRYNMFRGPDHHYFPGVFATPENLAKLDTSAFPPGIDIAGMLAEAHEMFYQPKN